MFAVCTLVCCTEARRGHKYLLYHSQLCSFETPSLTEVGAFNFLSRGAVGHPRARLAPFPSVLALCVITGPGSTFLRRCWDLNSHSHAFILSHLSSPYRVLLMSGRTTLRRRSRGQRLFILFTEIS